MTAWNWLTGLLAGAGVSASAFWMAQMLRAARHRRELVRLQGLDQDPSEPPGGWPSLAILLAARNEEATIEPAVRAMLAADYPNLTVLAVDDRSTDRTGAILDRLAGEFDRLRVLHVEDLPDGWLGKTHALQRASEATDAEWLLLTDADVVIASRTLRTTIAHALAHRLDHVTIAPSIPTETFGERLFLALFQMAFGLANLYWEVERPDRRAHIGIGAFNLVRSERFRAIGGFRRLALSVDDDMRLAEALKASGGRPRMILGGGAVSVRWQVGLSGMVRGLEKNFFAATRYRLGAALAASLLILWMGAAPHIGLFVGPWWSRIICAMGVLTIAASVRVTGAQSRVAWYYGLILPLSAAVCSFTLLRSAWFTLRRRGIRWREHHYPLEQLRSHVRARDAWLREVWRFTR